MIEYCVNRASAETLVAYFEEMRRRGEIRAVCIFPPYVAKLRTNAVLFEAWENNVLVGFCAMYCNRAEKDFAFIPQINLVPEMRRRGIATRLIFKCVDYMKKEGFSELRLFVNNDNETAISFYHKLGFTPFVQTGTQLKMVKRVR